MKNLNNREDDQKEHLPKQKKDGNVKPVKKVILNKLPVFKSSQVGICSQNVTDD